TNLKDRILESLLNAEGLAPTVETGRRRIPTSRKPAPRAETRPPTSGTTWASPSKVQAHGHGHDAVPAGAVDPAEVRVVDDCDRAEEVGPVQDAESVGAQFDALGFCKLDALDEVEVEGERTGALQETRRQVAGHAGGGIDEQDSA